MHGNSAGLLLGELGRMAIENVRVSEKARQQLITLKRKTGIRNWNTLCRWGLCASLAEQSIPPETKIPADSSVEMTWRTFGGEYADVYLALIRQRCQADGLGTDDEVVAAQFRLHLHRGIANLAGDRTLRSIQDLISRALV